MQEGKKEEGRRVPVCLHIISCCVGQGDSLENILAIIQSDLES